MGSAVLLCGRTADVQKFCFQTAIRSDMCSAELQGGLLEDCQEWRIVAAKISDKVSILLQEDWFANAQESCFLGALRWNMGGVVQHLGRIAGALESRIQAESRSKMGSALPPMFDLLMLRNHLFRLRKSNVGSSVMKGLRFADSQKSRFQASNCSNLCSAVLVGGRSADIHEFIFKLQNVQIWIVSNCKGVCLLIVRNCIFRLRNVQISAVPSYKRVDLLMLRISVCRVRNVEIWAVLSSNKVDLLMLSNRVSGCEMFR